MVLLELFRETFPEVHIETLYADREFIGIDSDLFHTRAIEILLPELPACSVIVMDNASFHKRQDTLDALQAEGHTVLWLPPYSPDFNPIEKTWAWIKRLRKPWRLADVNTLLFWFFTLVTLY